MGAGELISINMQPRTLEPLTLFHFRHWQQAATTKDEEIASNRHCLQYSHFPLFYSFFYDCKGF